MNRALWVVRKNEVEVLIRQVSRHFGGDDEVWLKEYINEMVNQHVDYLNDLIRSLKALKVPSSPQIKALRKDINIQFRCPDCGYLPPFCYYLVTKECSNIKKKYA